MPRPFWKGSLSFGLVEIPVTLRPALETKELSFTLLDRSDFSPVGFKRYNKSTGREVEWSRVVRGFEYEPDEYVVLTDEDLRRANPKATRTIEILEFVDATEIDPVFFDVPYYIDPVSKPSKSHALLRAALERTKKTGVARLVLRTRAHLAAVLVYEDALVLELLHYPHEIRKPAGAEENGRVAKTARASDRELAMAQRLIEGMTAKWNPDRFKDEYYDDVMALVRNKVRSGETHTIVEPGRTTEPKPREVVDLMERLKQSLAQRAPRTPARAKAKRSTRSSARARKSA
jgi:DNA end-binding protein Ku